MTLPPFIHVGWDAPTPRATGIASLPSYRADTRLPFWST
jgi:hypothetical protein